MISRSILKSNISRRSNILHNFLYKTMSTSQSPLIGPIQKSIESKLTKSLNPISLNIRNDSHKHSHHRAMEGVENMTESHFMINIISDEFKGKSQPMRHRMIYTLLKDELENKGVHALQMKTKTSEEVKPKE